MILLCSLHFWYVKHVKSCNVPYIFLKIEQECRKHPLSFSFSASGHLTVVLGRIWTAQLLAPVVHHAGPSFSSTIWQRKGPFSYRCGMAQTRALQVPCGMCSPAWVLTCWGLRAQSVFCFHSQVAESGWAWSPHCLFFTPKLKFTKEIAPGTRRWQIWGLPTGVQAGDSAVPGGRGAVGAACLPSIFRGSPWPRPGLLAEGLLLVPSESKGSRLCAWLQTGFFSPPPQECIGRRQAVNLDGLLDDRTDSNEHGGVGQDLGLCRASCCLVCHPRLEVVGAQVANPRVLPWHEGVPPEASRNWW